MSLLYQLGIQLYGLFLRCAAWWNPKARKWVNGRKDWKTQLRKKAPPGGFQLWMHCSSLGEFEQGRPILEAYRQQFPEHQILLSFFSPSGYTIRKNYPEANVVSYLPLDTKANAAAFLQIANPALSIFVKYDFWPNYLGEIKKQQRKAWLIAARFHKQDQFQQWYGRWTRPYIHAFEKLFLQEGPKIDWYPQDQQWIIGDPRVDRVVNIQEQAPAAAALIQWKQGPVFVWGSVWEKDWPLLTALIQGPLQDWQHLIAPHQIEESGIKALMSHIGEKSGRITQGIQADKVVILDTIGQLSSAYQVGDMAYIGGGFGAGIHNTLEPLAAGLPTFFGPKHQKFPEASAAIAAGCGYEINNATEIVKKVEELKSPKELLKRQEKARSFIAERAGATSFIMNKMNEGAKVQNN